MKRRLLILSALITSIYFLACNNSGNKSSSNPYSEAPKMSEGKALFVNNCAICHDMKQDKTGPPRADTHLVPENHSRSALAASPIEIFYRSDEDFATNGKNAVTKKLIGE